MTLVESRDKCVREAAPVLKTGRKWAAKKAVEDAKAALRIGDIMGQVQHGRGGLGLSSAPPTWHKAAPAQRRKLVVNEVQKQEERMRCIKAEALISSYIRKWLGVPRCLSRVGLYGKGILQLPVSALTEEFKCAKVRLEMTLVESRDKCVREAAPVLKTGRKWAAKKAVEDAKAALRIGDIMGQVQHGRGGLQGQTGNDISHTMRWESVEQRKIG
ncbi:UNVERIFIED_CONTAM: hypothetical protein FKN15_003813 [Acipenser sinensis]